MSDTVAAIQVVRMPELRIEGRLLPEEVLGGFIGCVLQCITDKASILLALGMNGTGYVVAQDLAIETLRRHEKRAAHWFDERSYPKPPGVFVFPVECAETISVFARYAEGARSCE